MQRSKLLSLAAVLTVVTALGAVAPQMAEAQRRSVDINTPFSGQRPFQLDIHGGFTWWGNGVATGARFGIPLLQNGFVSSINNAVYLNFGVDFYWVERDFDGRNWHYGAGFGLPVALHWEFYFTENWSAFAELGVNVFFHPSVFHSGRGWDVHPGAWVLFQVGGRFHINEWFALTLRVGNPYVSFGITFLLG